MRYDAVLFDNDGIITTPTRRAALERAMREAFTAVGADDPADDHVETLIRPTVPSLEAVAAAHEVDAADLWRARERTTIDVQLAELRAGRKTLYDDVAAVTDLPLPRGIVSNNQHETIGNVVEHFDLTGFDPWYGREPTLASIRRKKPRPYYLDRAIEEMGAENPLYVGDSRVDVAAADACGIDSAFVRRPHRSGYALDVDPTYEVESLTALDALVAGEQSGND